MEKTVTVKINEEDLVSLQRHADMENMTLDEFILTAAIRYVDQNELIDELQLADILENEHLLE